LTTIAEMAPLTLQSTYKLVSGFEIPVVGFGVSEALDTCDIAFQDLTFTCPLGLPNVSRNRHDTSRGKSNSLTIAY
jgi:hypothetical protein